MKSLTAGPSEKEQSKMNDLRDRLSELMHGSDATLLSLELKNIKKLMTDRSSTKKK